MKASLQNQVQKNKIQVPEDQETLQVHQKNVAQVLVLKLDYANSLLYAPLMFC